MGFDYGAKVRGLLAMADDESLSDEARQSYRNAAFRIMRDYQIAEEDALAVDPTISVPIHVEISFRIASYEMRYHYTEIARAIAKHTGCRVHIQYGDVWAGHPEIYTFVGYEGDIRYAEFLWTSAFLMFSTKIDPVWDESVSTEVNVYRMRGAGILRKDIAIKAYGENTPANRSKVQRVYLAQAEKHGDTAAAAGLGFDSKTYRENYADDFTMTLRRRLRAATDAADSVGGGLVLAGRKDRVNEAFYEMFPDERPVTTVSQTWVDPRTTCTAKACREGRWCRAHMYLKPREWTQADQARENRRNNSPSARAGQAAGRAAAEGVVMRGTTPRADRIERSGKAIEG